MVRGDQEIAHECYQNILEMIRDHIAIFNALQPGAQVQNFQGFLVGFSGEKIQINGHIILETMFRTEATTRTVKVNFLVVDTSFPYNA